MLSTEEETKAGTGALVAQILVTAASETTAHGLSRLAGQRPLYVKICWLLAFLTFLGVFSFSMYGFTDKLIKGEISTSYEAEAVKFEFPDVYFCNGVQISGTYSITLEQAVVNDINSRMNATFSVFDTALQNLLNTPFGANRTAIQIEQLRLYRLKSAIQSMPYRLLVDKLSHKEQQMVLKNDSSPDVTLKPFYHPNHLKCLKVELTEQRREELSKVNSEASFQFLLDPYFTELFHDLNATYYPQVRNVTVPLYNNLTTFVYDWDLDMPYEIDRPMGMRLYLAPKGEYPSRFVTNFLLAPGRSYSIGLTMQNIKKSPEAYMGKCLTEAPDVQFFNPYNDSPYTFRYSNSFCYFSEFAKQLAKNSCTPYVNPLPWDYRQVRFCLNFTGLNASQIQANLLQAFGADTSALGDFQQMCQTRQLCTTRQYTTSTSSANWPNENGQIRVLTEIMAAILAKNPDVYRPSWRSAYNIVWTKLSSWPDDFGDAEKFANKYFSRSGLKVTLRAEESRSPQIFLSSGYSLQTYIADMGGTAGIYLGCSLLSLCELLELLYNLIIKTRKKRKVATSGNVVMVRPASAASRTDVASFATVSTGTLDLGRKSEK